MEPFHMKMTCRVRIKIYAIVLLSTSFALAASVPLQVTPVAPARTEVRHQTLFADFGADAYGNLEVRFSSGPPARTVTVRLGEKLDGDGAIDRQPPGSVNFREIRLAVAPGQSVYRLAIPSKPLHQRKAAVKMPGEMGEVTPFRYAEIEGLSSDLVKEVSLRQLFVHAPFDDTASDFQSSDETLNAVWKLCKHTMKATTAFGVYIDGERERIPYEADAYINLLSHYACDLDPRVARATFAHLMANPTWPTEWSLHMPMIAAADYMATGDPVLARDNYDALKKKLLSDKAREDGLLVVSAVVDWPDTERDGYNGGVVDPQNKKQVGPPVNTVANAFYYHALTRMALLARALDKADDARHFEDEARRVYASFNQVFFDEERKIYTDGDRSPHASLHANMFPLAFGLVPAERISKVTDFVESRGMACSVYGAQYLLEGLFDAGRDESALRLLTSHSKRSWFHMIESGSTMTWEAWDVQFKKNLTWNHAWGSAPANILSRYVLGVRPASAGYKDISIAPHVGALSQVGGRVPTPMGPVVVSVMNTEAAFGIDLDVPSGARATVTVPSRPRHQLLLDNKLGGVQPSSAAGVVEVPPGRHTIQSR
jgi:alpha-L-rhamnosidase